MIMPSLAAALLILTAAAPAAAKPHFKSGELRVFTPEEVASPASYSFETLLAKEDWDGVLDKYFGRLYDGRHPDWVVAISSTGHVSQSLRWRRRDVETLPGERTLWVVVFAVRPSTDAPPSAWRWSQPAGGTLRLRYDALETQTGPAEAVVHALAKVLPKGAGGLDLGGASSQTTDSSYEVPVTTIALHPLAPGTSWYVGMGSVRLKPRTSNRLTLVPGDDKVVLGSGRTAAKAAVLNFGNGDRSMVAASLAGGFAFNAKEGATRSHAAGNAYLLGHLYLPWTRPGLPWRQHSFSLTLGTGLLRDRFFKDFVTGVTWGHLAGATGLVVGAQWYDADSGGRRVWRAAPFVGWNVPL